MLFEEHDPIEAFHNYLSDHLPEVHAFDGPGYGLVFAPHQVEDIAQLFSDFTGEPLEKYLPEKFLGVIAGLLLTSEAAICKGHKEEGPGLTIFVDEQGIYQLTFAVVWTDPWTVIDDVVIQNPYLAFTIICTPERRISVSAVVGSGHIRFLEYDLDLQVAVQVPSLVIQAHLRTEQEPNASAPEGMTKDYLGTLKHADADSITIEDIRFSAAPRLKNFQLSLSVTNVLNLHDKFRVNRFQAEINYRGSTARASYGILAHTELEIGFEPQPLIFSLSAGLDKQVGATKWHFFGAIDHPIKVHEILEGLAGLFQEGSADVANDYDLPDFVSQAELTFLGLGFEIATGATAHQEYTFTFGLSFPVEGRAVHLEIYAKYSRSSPGYAVELTGAVNIDGLQLAVGFARKSGGQAKSDTLMLASLTSRYVIHAHDLIFAIAPDLVGDVPIEVDIHLLGLLLGVHAGNAEQKDYLFRLLFALDIGLDKFPLIGHMLSSVKFTNGQLLAANRAWNQADVEAANSLIDHFPDSPEHITGPNNAKEMGGIGKGISLSGRFELTEDLGFPLFLHFGGDAKTTTNPQLGSGSGTPPPPGNPDARSQSKIDQVIKAVRIKKVALIFENGQIGIKITGGLALAVFEFELMGLQVTVPQSVLNDPFSAEILKGVDFSLDGFGAKIQKGRLSIMGAFLRMHYDDHGGYDEYNGIIQVAFPPFMLTGMGSYANFPQPDGHPSLFLFVAIGFPITLSPALLIEGFALGFGIHRDFILPEIDEVLSYPLIQVTVTPPPEIDIQKMAEAMHKYFPPTDGTYFVVAGIKFKVFGLIDTVAMLAVKFGRAFEIDLIGVSSVCFPAVFIELAWEARFVPAEGYILVRGQLTSRSYLLIENVQLTGGFAVAAWALGTHQGDFVATIGGYHAHYRVPDHYPNHVPRLGISFCLDPITVKGGVYFAITAQALMLGGFLEASLEASFNAAVVSASFKAAISLAMDALINFEPFHYDLMIAADATLDASLSFTFYTKHIHHHLHFDAHIWGPDFSGTASIDVGPKAFDISFGTGGKNRALPIAWSHFYEKFLGADDTGQDKVLGITITQGQLQKVKEGETVVYVVDPKQVVIEVKSLIPITSLAGISHSGQGPNPSPGIAPMDISGGGFSAVFTPPDLSEFKPIPVRSAVPKGIWGGEGLKKPDISGGSGSLLDNVLTGITLTPAQGAQTEETHPVNKSVFSYDIDEFPLAEKASTYTMTELKDPVPLATPTNEYDTFTGLGGLTLAQVETGKLLHTHLSQFKLTLAE